MKFSVFVCMMLMSNVAYAEYFTGNDLSSWSNDWFICEGDFNGKCANASGMYFGYVMGVIDTLPYNFIPNNIKVKQLLKIVYNYIQTHPEQWQEPARYIVGRAVGCAFKPTGLSYGCNK